MKKTKRLGSIIIALALVMLSTVTSFAATDTDVLDHVFEAYQIFKAESVNDEYLTNVQWGSAFTSSNRASYFLRDLLNEEAFEDENGVSIFEDCDTAGEVAEVLSEYEDYSDVAKAFAKFAMDSKYVSYFEEVNHGEEISEAGYYLFVDATTDGLANTTIIKMVANQKVEIEVKTSVPQMEKKVMENSYDVNYESLTLGTENGFNYGTGYNDVADYSVGDAVPFRLYGTMPSTLDLFTEYYYSFVDTLSAGLAFTDDDADNTTVTLYNYVNGEYQATDVTDDFVVSFVENQDGTTTVKVTCEDILKIGGVTTDSIIVVDYNATLDEDAITGYDGNENVAYLEYSNNPNYPEDENGNRNTDETEEDRVIVFTYELDVTKVDTDENVLEGATFYILNEDDEYYSANGWVADEADAKLFTSDEDGMFVVDGLDEGTYTIIEKDAPEGYQPLDEDGITFVITADILPDVNDDDAQTWTSTAKDALYDFVAEITYDKNNAGTIEADKDTLVTDLQVINTKAYDLPGTGGMGTTLIYLAGGALILAALAFIVIKRRANA